MRRLWTVGSAMLLAIVLVGRVGQPRGATASQMASPMIRVPVYLQTVSPARLYQMGLLLLSPNGAKVSRAAALRKFAQGQARSANHTRFKVLELKLAFVRSSEWNLDGRTWWIFSVREVGLAHAPHVYLSFMEAQTGQMHVGVTS